MDARREGIVSACVSGSTIAPCPAASGLTFWRSIGADAVRPKSANTIPIVEHYVRDYLVKRFGEQIAEDIKPLEIQRDESESFSNL